MSDNNKPSNQKPDNQTPDKSELDKTMTQQKLTEAELDVRLANLITDIKPDVGVWQAIAQQLDAPPELRLAKGDARQGSVNTPPSQAAVEQRESGSSWYEMATAAAFAAATAAFIVWGQLAPSTSLPEASQVQLARAASFELHEQHGAELIRVRQELRKELRGALEELSPATRLVVVENLTRIEEARAEIESALQTEPGNRLLEQLLLTSYTNELTLLNQFTGLARSAQQRTRL